MMRLWLSSFGVGDNPEELVRLVGRSSRKAAVIGNAADAYGRGPEWDQRQRREMEALALLGLKPEGLDLCDYFGKPAHLAARLEGFGLVWVRGGNTFVLRRAMKASGFDAAIRPLLEAGCMVYGGYSAGIIAATPTLRGTEFVDRPELVPENYPTELVWEGMGLVEYSLAPHYRSNHPESRDMEKVVAYFQENGMAYKTLRDGEVLVVDGKIEVLLR